MDDLAEANAVEFLEDLTIVAAENLSAPIDQLGRGLDGLVELHELEENGEKKYVAVKTATKESLQNENDSKHRLEVNQTEWVL